MATSQRAQSGKKPVQQTGYKKLAPFGIKNAYEVAFLLPKEYWDYTNLITDYRTLVVGSMACVGGIASEFQEIGGPEERQDEDPIEVFQEEFDEPEEDDASSENDEIDGIACSTESEEDEQEGNESSKYARWQFKLIGENRYRDLYIQITTKTAEERDMLEIARSGRVVHMYGRIEEKGGKWLIRNAEHVESADIGTTHTRYPSKRYKVTITKQRRGKAKGKRKITRTFNLRSQDVEQVIGSDLKKWVRLGSQHLRTRLNIQEGPFEWALMSAIESPAPVIEGLLRQAHQPTSMENGLKALKALRRLEALDHLREIDKRNKADICDVSVIKTTAGQYQHAISELKRNGNVDLSEEQVRAVLEILYDLQSEYKLNRLLAGDVGTGKTFVFGVVAALVAGQKKLSVVLEPTRHLATEVYEKLSSYWPEIKCILITGKTGHVEIPESGILIGTTGIWPRLLKTDIAPGLIVVDEQQKYGTRQRNPIEYDSANVLEVTATPIPRTQSLAKFSGMDVSRLKYCHQEKNIKTTVVQGEYELDKTYKKITDNILQKGLNAIFVFPDINPRGDEYEENEAAELLEDERDPPKSVIESYERWSKEFPGQVGMVHGEIDSDETADTLAKFKSGKYKILIGTSIIEVGIDFKDVRQMVIHHPEAFGLSKLHQLRGRLARQGGKGWCHLATRVNCHSIELLQAVANESDGDKIAEMDLSNRGPGDPRVNATQQKGEHKPFLIGIKREMEDMEFVDQNCYQWVRGDHVQSADLTGIESERKAFMKRMMNATKEKPIKKQRTLDNPEKQVGLFD